MTARHVALIVGAVLLLGLALYLLVEVRAQPALPSGASATQAAQAEPATPTETTERPSERAASPAPRGPGAPGDRAAGVDATPPTAAGSAIVVVPPIPALAGDRDLPKPKLDAMMDEANKAYDRGDYDDAKTIAARLLATFPTNVRMLRIMVSASCLEGDAHLAQYHFARLPPPDQEQMKVRCARYGVTFSDGQ